MRVKREQLQEGCILQDDVFSITSQPIIPRRTVLTSVHLEVLQAYMVCYVSVEKTLIDGTPFEPESMEESVREEKEKYTYEDAFLKSYLKAVQSYKIMFHSWENGGKVNMEKMLYVLSPLFDQAREAQKHYLMLHHYSTKEDYLYHHAIAVSLLSYFLAKKHRFTHKECLQAGIAGAMCDAGMSKLPSSILKKTGPLVKEDYNKVKKHPFYSFKMLKEARDMSENILLAVLQHHEREDGSGYPLEIKSNKIHKLSRVTAVADVYHAMTSERYYRGKHSPYQVIEEMARELFGKLHPGTIQLLMNALLTFSIGTEVRLSNGEKAEIIHIDEKTPGTPFIRLKDTEEIMQITYGDGPVIDEIISY